MADMFDTAPGTERVILLGVSLSDRDDTEASLNELSELLETAGAETAGRLVQKRERPDPGTYFGKGKIQELKELIFETEANAVCADDELSPAQMKNLKDRLDVKVMDRTMVILDIFARHADTAAGKIQVELAGLQYSAAHLEGLRASLSRLGGGIGTRGPGETKIELDRRLIHDRISHLKAELKELDRHRGVTRKMREKSGAFIAAIAGYTNAGKSTLLNRLTAADVRAEDKLFATLDPATRKLELPNAREILLTDTVGFIRKLPHHLVDAFRSTLEETRYADVIIHVVDASDPEMDEKMLVVYDTLRSLGVLEDKEIITVYNKMDIAGGERLPKDIHASAEVRLSAATGEGTERLIALLTEFINRKRRPFERVFPYSEAGKIGKIRERGELISEEYTEEGIRVKAMVPPELLPYLR